MFSCPKPLFFDYFYWQIQKFEYKKRFMSCLFLFQEVTTLPTKYPHLIWWRGHNRSWFPIQSIQTTFAHSKIFRTAVAWHHSFFHICNHFIMTVSVSSACIIFHIPFRMSWHLQFQSFGWKRVISAPSGMESLYSVYSTISDICSNSQVPFFTFNLFSGINCIKMVRMLVRLHT